MNCLLTLVVALQLLILALPVQAAVKAKLEVSGNGVQIVVTGAGNANTVEIKAGKSKFKLKKKGAKWLSAVLTGEKAKSAGTAAGGGKIKVTVKAGNGKSATLKTALAATPEVKQAAAFGGARPAEVRGEGAIAAFQARISGRIIRWVDNPASFNSSETWGFAPNGQAVTYYFSPATVGSPIDQKYYVSWNVIDAILHPASIPGAEMVGQIKLGDDYYNIAFLYNRIATNNPNVVWEGAYAKPGGGETPFFTMTFVSESQIGP